jgi:CRP-like cAMP-binding protein
LFFQQKADKIYRMIKISEIRDGKCPLFEGIETPDLEKLLVCLKARRKKVTKGAYVAFAGDSISSFGVVLSGSLHISYNDYWGRRSILEKVSSGSLYGVAFAFSRLDSLPISIEAAEDSILLNMPVDKITTPCSSSCAFHKRIIANTLTLLSRNTVGLIEKIHTLSCKSTREKLLMWLSSQAMQAGSPSFTVSFSRQELADYLAVERSAMSAELSRMQKEGLIDYHRNSFELKKTTFLP